MEQNQTPIKTVETSHTRHKRKPMFAALGIVVAIAAIGSFAYWHFVGSRYVTTDNAYAAVEVAQVTPSVGGTIKEVKVVDTLNVKKGDVLVVIDDTDAKLVLAQAEAELGRAVRRVRGMMANDEGLGAMVQARAADELRVSAQLKAAEADFERARIDLKRREALAESGSVSGDELTHAQNAFANAQANLQAARAGAEQAKANRSSAVGTRATNAAMIDNVSLDDNPEVALARARRDQARVDLDRTVVRAPVDGVVAKRQVQVGQRVAPGTPLLAVVPLSEMHVDANFKEVQLEQVRVGQQVEVKADLYGDKVVYKGVVDGFSGGTGSAFSLIPAQNASGNWIKVVQRLPVRVKLDPQTLQQHPLQVGLSMHVSIDTRSAE
jgi:membrane fusion protein, multidrug efflux system